MDVERQAWSMPNVARPTILLIRKLKNVNQRLRAWNKNVLGNIMDVVKLAKEDVQNKGDIS